MKTFLRKTTLFFVYLAGFILALILIQDTELIVGRKKLYVEKNENKKYDLFVLGSSRAMYTFNPMVYEGPKTILNMGEEGQGLPSNYLMIKMFVEKYGVKIDKLLLQVDEYALNGSKGFSRKFRDDFFVTDIDDPEVFDAYKRYRGAAFANTLQYFPQSANLVYCDLTHFVKYQVLSLKRFVPKLQSVFENTLHESVKLKGFKPVKPVKVTSYTTDEFIIEPDDQYYFEKLVSYSKQHGIALYFYRAPILNCHTLKADRFQTYIDSFVKANNIPFYDYKCEYQWPEYYTDQSHPAGKISELLTKDILKKLEMGN